MKHTKQESEVQSKPSIEDYLSIHEKIVFELIQNYQVNSISNERKSTYLYPLKTFTTIEPPPTWRAITCDSTLSLCPALMIIINEIF
jgi:hypothetical protein